MGPLEHGGRTTEKSEGWPAGCGPVRRRHRDVPSANPGGRARILSTWMCSGRVRGVAFSLVTFSLLGQREVTKRKATPVLRFRPSMDEKSDRAGRACRRAIHGAAASGRNPLRPPCGPDRPALTAAQGPRKSSASRSAIHGLLRSKTHLLASPGTCAQGARQQGPLEHGARTTGKSEGWPAGCGPVRRRHRDVPSANPGGRARILSTWMCSGRVRGVAFSLVTFSWLRKRKLPAPPGGARKKTGMSQLPKRRHWITRAIPGARPSGRLRRSRLQSCKRSPAFAEMTAKASGRRYGVHLRCAWIDITTPNPASSVIADVP